MKTNSMLCCALALAALAACGGGTSTNSTTGASGSTSGASSSGSTTSGASTTTGSSTSGGTCAALAASCQTKACCSGICNASSKVCEAAGSTTSTSSSTSGSVNPCTPVAAGGNCGTSLDCAKGLLCVPDAGGTTCETPTAGLTKCTSAGFAPSASTGPCCESEKLVNGVATCAAWNVCALPGNTCTTSGDCCADGRGYPVTCKSGVCTSCGTSNSTCTSNADCCEGGGFQCLPNALVGITGAGSTCQASGLPVQFDDAGSIAACVSQQICAANPAVPPQIECTLGALCATSAGGDPCAPLGMVCDTAFSNSPGFGVCDNPSTALGTSCIPGGPACGGNAFSTAPGVCFDLTSGGQQFIFCDEPCNTTEDCSGPSQFCYTQLGPGFCQPTTGTCTVHGATCKLTVANDGLCARYNFPPGGSTTGPTGICLQGQDGGAAGVPCNISGNRQIGGLCDNQDFCETGVCGPVCNSGTGTPKACPMGQACIPALGFGQSADMVDFGACITPCSLTADGGSCLDSSAGAKQKCIPSEFLGYSWAATAGNGKSPDMCGYMSPNAIALGADCSSFAQDNALDPCVAGAICVGVPGSPSVCTQICTDTEIGKTGAAGGCPAGQQCQGLNFTGTASTHLGVGCPPAGPAGRGGATSRAAGGSTTGSTTGGATTTGGSTSGTTSGTTTGTTSSSSTTG